MYLNKQEVWSQNDLKVDVTVTINIIVSQDVKTGRRGTLARVFAHRDVQERRLRKKPHRKIYGCLTTQHGSAGVI